MVPSEQIAITIAEAKSRISIAESLERLYSNRDFQVVFTEGWLKEYPVRLVALRKDPQAQSEYTQKSIMGELDAIGHMQQYMHTIMQMGTAAKESLEEEEAERELLIDEEVNRLGR